MATQRWKGTAAAVAQITTLTPASVEVGDVFTVAVNGKSVSYTAAVATVADVCSGLASALAGSTLPEFKEFTAQNGVTQIALIGNIPGRPFAVSTSTTDGGGNNTQTLVANTVTPATGPNHWSDANNWSTGMAPVSGDDVYFDSGGTDCLYGLSQAAVTLNSLNILQAYTGKIGLPLQNAGGYYEYRTVELTISATTVNVGQLSGNGSGRIKLNVGSAPCTLNVYNTGQPAETGIPALLWRGTSGSNTVNLNKGIVGLAFFPGDAATVSVLRIGYVSNPLGDVQAICGAGCTFTTINKQGGSVIVNAGATTMTQNAGTLTVFGAGGVTTLNVDGGTVVWNSTGAITTANVTGSALLDFSQDQQAKTVTNPINRFGNNSQIKDPFQVVGTLAIDLNQSMDLTNLDIGTNVKLTRGTPP